MQTSSFTALTLYCSQKLDAPCLLPLLPEGTIMVENLDDILPHRRAILITHDQSSARSASQWVSEQPKFRHTQIMLILPDGQSRLNPPCTHQHRPLSIKFIQQFLHRSRALPPLATSLKLTEIETSLVEQLYVANASVAHETLMQNVWGHTADLETHTLETHLYRLRKKLEKTSLSIITDEGSYQLLLSSTK